MATSIVSDSQPAVKAGANRSARNPGRVAGLWYLLIVLLGPVRLIYIPNKLFVHGNAAATAGNIAANETLFRIGIISDLACAVALIFLVLAFYKLFEGVDRTLAVLVVIFGGVLPGILYFVGAAYDGAALAVARGADFLGTFGKAQQDAIATLFLNLHQQQNTAAETLWGIWLLPLALLIYRSGFLPRFIGIWLAINGIAYVILSAMGELAPQYDSMLFLYAQPALFGELVLTLWLLIKGARPPAAAAISTPDAE